MSSALFTPDHSSRLDKLQIAALGGLMFLGAAFVYSATTSSEAARALSWYNQLWVRQLIWYSLGAAAAATLCCVDYRTLARWSLLAYSASVFLLVVVLFLGTKRAGARRWV